MERKDTQPHSSKRRRAAAGRPEPEGREPEDNEDPLGCPVVVGTSRALFRPYFRLGGTPDAATVRPEKVLRRSLHALVQEETAPPGGWEAVREQLCSLRQDLLVQHLHRGELAAEVGLEGVRLAAAAGDVTEMHRSLTSLVCRGHCASQVRSWPPELRDEVSATRLLYLTHGGGRGRPGRLESELLEFFAERLAGSEAVRPGPALLRARQLHKARVCGNWLRQLRLGLKSGGDGEGLSQLTCGMVARLLAPAARSGGLARLSAGFPHGIPARRAAALLGLEALDLVPWLAPELKMSRAEVVATVVVDGRLVTPKVQARLEELARLAAEGPPGDGDGRSPLLSSSTPGYSLVPLRLDQGVACVEGEAAIWSELRSGRGAAAGFAASHSATLRKMAAAKQQKKAAKKAKKESAKAKKKLKKAKKKLKKKAKRQRKALQGGSKRAAAAAPGCVSSSDDSDSDTSTSPTSD